MSKNNPFFLVDLTAVQEQVKIKRSTIFQRISDGDFPEPIGGTQRACWPQLQIVDYLYQVSRYGSWSKDRADKVLDSAYTEAMGLSRSSAKENNNDQL